MPRRRIVFMGSPGFAIPALDRLAESHDIMAVYSQPPRRAGRGMQEHPQPVAAHAATLNIPAFHPQRLSDAGDLAILAGHDADMFVVVAYGLLLPRRVLDMPRFGCINGHASLLPRWRGAAPIQRALMAGDKETGVAIMQMAAGLDTGPVLLEKRIAIDATDTAQSLHDKLAALGGAAIGAALTQAHELTPRAQAETGVTYAEKIDKAEAKIDFTRPATLLDAHIRGLSPFPGAWFEANGKRVKVLAAEPLSDEGATATLAESGAIYCGVGALRLVTVQPAGKGAMSGADFLRGRGLVPGQKLDI